MPSDCEDSAASNENETQADPDPTRDPAGTPARPEQTLIGIGASAGGLAALKEFFRHVPEDCGLPFVVVVHLSPEHESHLAELLQPHCRMPVQQVTETVALEPNRVYVIPPNGNLDSIDTHLRLTALEERAKRRLPVDHFFRTMAETHDGNAIGVVLTGTGSDGTLGLRRIREAGGLTIAQDPEEAEYDGMPRSAIADGVVDLVLAVREMPARILRFAQAEPKVAVPAEGAELISDDNRILQKILAQLRARTGHDFTRYKRSTIMRRIRRRMQLHHVVDLPAYLELLREQRAEAKHLFDDLLITVTEFFRDRKVFEHLAHEVIPRIFDGKDEQDSVRAWSVGCSTGEEAYSLTMLLLQEAERREQRPRIQVFASDLHEESLAVAREGTYPESIASNVSPPQLNRLFTQTDGSYRVRREVRELIVFAPHNLLKDPPFSHLDLIVCRNLLIYLQRDVQQDVISVFHYALEPDGSLVLGSSETIDPSDLFICDDKAHSVYRRRDLPKREPQLPVFPFTDGTREAPESGEGAGEPARPAGYGDLHARMVEQYAPPSILLSRTHDVVHYSAQAGEYLQLPGGEPTNNVFKLIREPFRIELRAALHTAKGAEGMSRSRPIDITVGGERRRVALQVCRATDSQLSGFFLVIFDEVEPVAETDQAGDQEASTTISELESEFDLTKDRLQAVIEEHETTHEEMQASNEELQSTNEELRSTLEELETSKEELQSMNEELTTLNQENRHRVEELSQLSADLQNLLAATDIATIFLDREMRIVRFTPKVGDLFNIRSSDRGRPLSDLTHHFSDADLQDGAKRVLEELVPIERELRSDEGRWYLSRATPYRTADDRIDGVVLTLIDITDRKQAEQHASAAKEYAESIIETLSEPLLVLNADLTVRSANAAFYDRFKVVPDQTLRRKIYDLGNGQWDIPELRSLLEDVLPEDSVFTDYQVEHEFEDLGHRVMLVNGRRLDHVQLILLGIHDITDRKRAEDKLRESEQRYRELFESIDQGFCVIEVELDESGKALDYWFVKVNPAFEGQTGIVNAEGRRMREIAPDHEEHWFEIYGQVARTGEPVRTQRPASALGRFYDVYAFPVGKRQPYRVGVLFRDIAEQKRAEDAVRQARDEAERHVAERTGELEEQKARFRDVARELAAAEHRERKRLAAILHDELQQFLIAVKMHLGKLRRAKDPAVFVSTVEESIKLTDDAIRSSRTLTHQLRPPVLYEDGLVPALRWLVSQKAEKYDLNVQVRAGRTRIPLNEDVRAMLFESVRELLFNVVKHAGVKEAMVEVQWKADKLRITVADRGKGFDLATIDRKKRKRNGMGLFSVRERLELIGGTMHIRTHPGDGAEITLEMPLAIAGEVEAEAQAADDGGGDAQPDAAPGMRVLVVDDHAIVREGIVTLLDGDPRVSVVGQAGDGIEAIDSVEMLQPDVVLMDVNMPRMNGLEATRKIRQRWPRVRVIGLSVQDDPATAKSMLDAGADAFIPKSDHGQTMVETILSAGSPSR